MLIDWQFNLLAVAALGAAVTALATLFCAWKTDRIEVSLERESSKTQALLAEIRDKLGK